MINCRIVNIVIVILIIVVVQTGMLPVQAGESDKILVELKPKHNELISKEKAPSDSNDHAVPKIQFKDAVILPKEGRYNDDITRIQLDLGILLQHEKVEEVITFKNNGTTELKISNLKAG